MSMGAKQGAVIGCSYRQTFRVTARHEDFASTLEPCLSEFDAPHRLVRGLRCFLDLPCRPGREIGSGEARFMG